MIFQHPASSKGIYTIMIDLFYADIELAPFKFITEQLFMYISGALILVARAVFGKLATWFYVGFHSIKVYKL